MSDLNQDNTLLGSLNIDDIVLSQESQQDPTSLKTKPKNKRQKFAALSLNKSQKEPHHKQWSENLLHKDSNMMDDTLDNFDETHLLLTNEWVKPVKKGPRSVTNTVVEANSMKAKFGSVKKKLHPHQSENSKITQLTQFFTSTQVMNQIESALSEEFKHPEVIHRPALKEMNKNQDKNNRKERGSLEKLSEIFNDSSCLEIEHFFDELEHSISAIDVDVENKNETLSRALEILVNSQVVNNQLTGSNNEQLQLSLSEINASFATSLRQALLSNAYKNVETSTQQFNSTLITTPNVKYANLGPFYGLPMKVKELIKSCKGIDELYDWQDECLRLPAIQERKNLIYALPTSGGKTLVAEILMLRELMCYKRNAIFILPYVAIVQEKVWALSSFAVALDFLVEEYAASKGTYPPRKRRRKNSIYIATIEKALGLINSLIETGRINEIGLIVVDELHLVGESGRGSTLEALLAKIMFIKADIQIVGMSATIGNVNDLCTFLKAEIYTQNFRPVELIEYVKCGAEVAKINGKNSEELFTVVRKAESSCNDIDPDGLGDIVMDVIPKDSCLIFCASKKNCENVANLLCKVVSKDLKEHRKEEKEQMKYALKDECGSLCKILSNSIQYGIAYHHSGLTNEERRTIEDAFRAGVISVICCTSTLAAGVNLPAKRVILRQPYVGREFITLSKYKQMVGRAGRAGLGETGDSILICNNQDLPKVKKLLMSPMDQALSGIHESGGKGLRHLLLSCIHLGLANTRTQLQAVSKVTLLDIQSDRLEVNVKKLTDKVISDLFKLSALQEADLTKAEVSPNCDISVKLETSSVSLNESMGSATATSEPSMAKKKRKIVVKNDTKLVISKLGRAAIKGNLELMRAHMLYDDLHQAQRSLVLLDSLHLLYLVTPYELAEQVKPNKTDYYNVYCKLNANELQTAKILGIDDHVALKMLSNQPSKNVPERVLNRFYLTLMLYDLWNEKPVFEVSEKYQINRGIVQSLMTSAATFASNVVNFCEVLDEFWTFAHLLKGMSQRLSHCCVRELLPLMELPAVKQSRAKQLYNAGYKTLQSIATANVEALVENIEFLPRRVAHQLISAAKMLLLEKVENLREEAKDIMEGIDNSKT